MRWAGWWAVLFCAIACGGGSSGPSDPGGGGAVTGPDGGVVDAGPSDAGSPPDCAGLVPAGPGGAVSFDVRTNPGDTCTGSAIDGQGVVAAGVQPAIQPQRWFVFAAPYGQSSGNFEAPSIIPQPSGFMGLDVSPLQAATVVVWDGNGGIAPGCTPSPVGNASSVVLGRSIDAGVISLSATPAGLTVRKHDAHAGEVASTTVSGAFTPRAVVEDASGGVLAVTANGSALSGFWVDLAKGTAGQTFPIGSATTVALRPLLGGGVLVQLDGAWAGVMNTGETALHAVPSWLASATDLVPVRGGKAYALIKGAGAVGIVSAQGSSCGSVTFPGVSSISIGVDGSAAGSTGSGGCTRYLWRNVLH